jgi:hypothetical protein
MFDLSHETANGIFDVAIIALIVGAALVLLGAITALWTSGIRQRYENELVSKYAADTAAANASAESARADSARASLLAEQETVARLRLEARLADRTLTPEQQTRLVDQMSPFRGQTVDVIILTDSSETKNFGNAIVSCLERAGLPMNVARVNARGTVARGVLIGVRDGSPSKVEQLAVVLSGVLQESGGTGVSRWTYDQITIPLGTVEMTRVGSAEPKGASPIRLVVGAK